MTPSPTIATFGAALAQIADAADLFFGKQFGIDFVDAQHRGDGLAHFFSIAGQQHRAASHGLDFANGGGGFGAENIDNVDGAGYEAILRDHYFGEALRRIRFDGKRNAFGLHERAGADRGVDPIDFAEDAFAGDVAKIPRLCHRQRPFGGSAGNGSGERMLGKTFRGGGNAHDIAGRGAVEGQDFDDFRRA